MWAIIYFHKYFRGLLFYLVTDSVFDYPKTDLKADKGAR